VENFDPSERAPSLLEFRQEELPRIRRRSRPDIKLLTEEPKKEVEKRDFLKISCSIYAQNFKK